MSVAVSPVCAEILESEQVPTLPEVAIRIIDLARQPDPDLQELVQTIRADPDTAARILKFANSALLGLRHKSKSIEAAVPILGTTMLRSLILGFTLPKETAPDSKLAQWFRKLWRDALFQAATAEALAERTPGADPPTWFLAGLLQDVGQLAMLNVFGERYAESVLAVDAEQVDESVISLEQAEFGCTHVDVSVGLCEQWNLDAELIAAIATHHDDATAGEQTFAIGTLTAAACCDYMNAMGLRLDSTRSRIEQLLLQTWGYLPEDMTHTLADFDARALGFASGFGIQTNLPTRETLLHRAQHALRQVAMESRLDKIRKHGDSDTEMSDLLDSGTSAYNPGFLDTFLPRELQDSHTDGATVGLLQLDLSSLENLPDGPVAPDAVVDLVTDCVRVQDCVVRAAESRFLVILPCSDDEMVQRVADRIQERISEALNLEAIDKTCHPVAGLVIVPGGRKSTQAAVALSALSDTVPGGEDSLARVRRMVGNKLRGC